MMSQRSWQAWVAVLLLFLCAACASPSSGWPVARASGSDIALAPDPTLSFNEMRNGFRWIAAPMDAGADGRVSLRLVVLAGSRHEFAGGEGAAHMLEHTAFRGTRNLADGDIQRRLGAFGLTLGRDLNAMTGQEATIYQIDLPNDDAVAVFTALTILREIASELLLDPAVLEAERGVVLAEERARDSSDARLEEAVAAARLGDHPHARPVIGPRENLERLSVDDLRRYYDAWYRPERAVLVIAGSVDPRTLRRVVEDQFGDWRGRGKAGVDPPPANAAPTETAAAFAVTGAGEPYLLVDWVADYAPRRPLTADRRAQLIDMLWITALNERLPVMLEAAGRPARTASVSLLRIAGVWEAVSASASAVEKPELAASTIVMAVRQAAAFGLHAEEVERARALQLAASARAASSRAASPAARANRLVDQLLLDGSAFQSPAQERELLQTLTAGVSLEEVNLAMRRRLGVAPHVIVAGLAGDPAAIQLATSSAVEQALAAPPAPYAARQAVEWPYQDFGTPGAVAERQHIADLDVTLVRFANGLTLSIKSMTAEANRVRATLTFGDGRSGLPVAQHAAAELGLTVWARGGLGRISKTQQSQALAADGVGLTAAMGDDLYLLRGAVHVSALRRQLELMAAMMSDPGFRTDDWGAYLAEADDADALAASTPVRTLTHRLPGLLRSGDTRWTPSTSAQRRSWKAENAIAFMRPVVAQSPMELRIVGDVDPDTVIASVGATLGALPTRATRSRDEALRRVSFPVTAEVIATPHHGRADQAALTVAWPTGQDLYADPQAWRVARLLGQMLQDRVTLRFRTGESSTYAPSSSIVFSRASPGFGYVSLSLELPPERIDEAFAAIDDIARELASSRPSPQELAWALDPLLVDARRELRDSLAFWSQNLARAHSDPRPLDMVRTHVNGHAAITPEAVQAAAQQWLVASKALRVKALPAR